MQPVPLKQGDHIEPRTVVHIAAVGRAGAKGREVLAVVADVAPGARSAVVGPRGRRAHVREDVVDCLLGDGLVAEIEVPHDHLLLARGIEAEFGAVRIGRPLPLLLARPHLISELRADVREGRISRLGLDEHRLEHLTRDGAVHEAYRRLSELKARLARTVEVPVPRLARPQSREARDGVHRPVRCDLVRIVEAAVRGVRHVFCHAPGGPTKGHVALVCLSVAPVEVA